MGQAEAQEVRRPDATAGRNQASSCSSELGSSKCHSWTDLVHVEDPQGNPGVPAARNCPSGENASERTRVGHVAPLSDHSLHPAIAGHALPDLHHADGRTLAKPRLAAARPARRPSRPRAPGGPSAAARSFDRPARHPTPATASVRSESANSRWTTPAPTVCRERSWRPAMSITRMMASGSGVADPPRERLLVLGDGDRRYVRRQRLPRFPRPARLGDLGASRIAGTSTPRRCSGRPRHEPTT